MRERERARVNQISTNSNLPEKEKIRPLIPRVTQKRQGKSTYLTRISRAKTLLQQPPKIMVAIRIQSCKETCIVNAARLVQEGDRVWVVFRAFCCRCCCCAVCGVDGMLSSPWLASFEPWFCPCSFCPWSPRCLSSGVMADAELVEYPFTEMVMGRRAIVVLGDSGRVVRV